MARSTRNKSKNGNTMELQASTSTSSNSEESPPDIYLEVEKLKSLNLQLAKKNAELKHINGTLCKDRLELINEVSSLKIQLDTKKMMAIELHGKIVELSRVAMRLIISGQDDMFAYTAKNDNSNRLNGNYETEHCSTSNTPNNQQARASNSPAVQQTRAVRPMISGHTIDRPVINLQRVSHAQLERLSERVRQGDVANESQEADVDPRISLELSNADFQAIEVEPIEDNENLSEQTFSDLAPEYQPLQTVFEDTEINSSSTSSATIDLTLTNESMPIDRVMRRRNNALIPLPIIMPAASPSAQRNNSTVNQSGSFSLADISNTFTHQGHVTTRRGTNKRQNITSVSQNMSLLLPSPSLCLSDRENNNSMVHNLVNDDDINLSDTQFMDDLHYRDVPVTSTPAVIIDSNKRIRRSGEGSTTPKPQMSSTPAVLIDSNKRIRRSGEGSTTLKPQMRNSMKRCSVILKRIAEPKRRSSSPKKGSTRRTAASKSRDTTGETEDSSASMAGSSNIASSPRKRPTRKTRPTNLKEPSSRKKLRR